MLKSLLKSFIYFFLSPFIVRRARASTICITFDDGPHPENTVRILDILYKHNVNAIFFMTGTEMVKYPEIVKSVIVGGHKVAYHGFSHISMRKQTFREFRVEMAKKKMLENQFNICLDLYRPPFGDLSFTGFIILAMNRCKIIMWSLDSRDTYDTEQQILETLSVMNISPGEILLFHDDYSKTVIVLDKLLAVYANAGIKCESTLI